MVLRVKNYDIDLTWKQGKEQVIADMLSGLVDPEKKEDGQFEHINMCKYRSMGEEKLQKIKDGSDKDVVLSTVKNVIMMGWPEDREKIPSVVTPYYSFASGLTIQDGIVFKGERVVILASLRGEYRLEIHGAHGSIQATLSRAREYLFWLGMAAERKQIVSSCKACRSLETMNQKETLMLHTLLDRHWEKVGVDMFELERVMYLITVDYYSKVYRAGQA